MRRALTYLGSRGQSEDLYRTFTSIVDKPVETDYTVDESKTIQLTDASITKAEKLLGVDNIHGSGIKYVHHRNGGARQTLFSRDKSMWCARAKW